MQEFKLSFTVVEWRLIVIAIATVKSSIYNNPSLAKDVKKLAERIVEHTGHYDADGELK